MIPSISTVITIYDNTAGTFALDRVASLVVLNEHYIPRGGTPGDELSAAFGAFIDGGPIEIILRLTPESRPFILRKTWHKSWRISELETGEIETRLTMNGILGIKYWLYRWVSHVVIMAPEELKKGLRGGYRSPTLPA